jgi:RNA polymerase sigma-70 factor (family 1)
VKPFKGANFHFMQIPDEQLRSDQELVEFLKKDSEKSFKVIYERYAPKLYHAAYNLLRNKEVCEDLVQELFTDLWVKRNRLEILQLKSYLYRSITNKALMVIRSGKATLSLETVEMLMDEYATDDRVIDKEMQANLDKGISSLPEKCREVFILSRKEQLTHKEIATHLNISVKTVENHLTKALKHLRASMGNFFFFILLIIFL